MLCSRRAREELDWRPRYDSVATLLELLEGIREGAGIRRCVTEHHRTPDLPSASIGW
jgi:hypothetical protein